jgi:hypothetical protein
MDDIPHVAGQLVMSLTRFSRVQRFQHPQSTVKNCAVAAELSGHVPSNGGGHLVLPPGAAMAVAAKAIRSIERLGMFVVF